MVSVSLSSQTVVRQREPDWPRRTGFEFRVENKLGSGYSVEMIRSARRRDFPQDQTYFQHGRWALGFVHQVSAEKPIPRWK